MFPWKSIKAITTLFFFQMQHVFFYGRFAWGGRVSRTWDSLFTQNKILVSARLLVWKSSPPTQSDESRLQSRFQICRQNNSEQSKTKQLVRVRAVPSPVLFLSYLMKLHREKVHLPKNNFEVLELSLGISIFCLFYTFTPQYFRGKCCTFSCTTFILTLLSLVALQKYNK